jgi:hypothetical protein
MIITDINIDKAIFAPNGKMSNEDYHKHDGISSSGLKTIFDKTPAHYKFGEVKQSDAMDYGTASHTALLEPHLFNDVVLIQPAEIKQRRGKAWDDFKASVKPDQVVVKQAEYDDLMKMRSAMHDHPEYSELLKGAAIESSIMCDIKVQGYDGWITVKVRPDIITKCFQVPDYKTTMDASMEGFGRSVVNMGYLIRQTFVCDVLSAYFSARKGKDVVFTPSLLAQEKAAPYIAQKYNFTEGQIAAGRSMWHDTITLYAKCLERDLWPAYFKGSVDLELPHWANKQYDIE